MATDNLPDWSRTKCFSTALRRADRTLTRVYDDALRPSGLGTPQYSLLSLIARAPHPLSIGELADVQAMDRTTLSRALTPLVRDTLVQIVPGQDRRTRIVSLTPAGETALAAARPLWRRAQDQVTALAGKDRIDTLLADLAGVVARVR